MLLTANIWRPQLRAGDAANRRGDYPKEQWRQTKKAARPAPISAATEDLAFQAGRKVMTKGEIAIANILRAALTGQTTVAQLKRRLADALAEIERVGVKHADLELIEELAGVESAITRIERERAKYGRQKNN